MIRWTQTLAGVAWAFSMLVLEVPASGQTNLATGSVTTDDGFLRINIDDYGSWAVNLTTGAGVDLFNPAGLPAAEPFTFTSGLFFFRGGTQRELLSVSTSWQGIGSPTFASDTSLNRAITSPGVPSIVGGGSVVNTLDSQFRVFGGGTNVAFSLRQNVSVATVGVSAILRQDYTVTNNAATAISFNLVRNYDGDLPWPGTGTFFIDDEVGTTTNGSSGQPYVYMQNPSEPGVTAVTLSSPQASSYYGGKNGVVPAGGTAFGFGTDVQQWNAFGIPAGWANHIAGVGTNVNGNSGPSPPGAATQPDGFIGLGIDVNQLAPGQSTTITICHTFGQNTPAPCPEVPEPITCLILFGVLGGLGVVRRLA